MLSVSGAWRPEQLTARQLSSILELTLGPTSYYSTTLLGLRED